MAVSCAAVEMQIRGLAVLPSRGPQASATTGSGADGDRWRSVAKPAPITAAATATECKRAARLRG